MNTCKDCEWWENSDKKSLYKKCPIIKNYLIICMDKHSLVDWIETDPDFGCIHWEEKSENKT